MDFEMVVNLFDEKLKWITNNVIVLKMTFATLGVMHTNTFQNHGLVPLCVNDCALQWNF